jgi:NADH-quinone oxidoreductase subunit J
MELAIFILTSLVAIIAALLVILQRNPIASVMYLNHLRRAGNLFIQLRAAFIAILQVIVYAGAIMVLFCS